MEPYMVQARQILIDLTHWMANTTILTVNGIDITFMGLLLFGVVFDLILSLISYLLPGWLGEKEFDGYTIEEGYNPYNIRRQ